MSARVVRALASTIAAALLLATGSVHAAYPDEPIKIIVPFGAGDAIDGTARVIADRMKSDLGVPVIIQNIPAAGGAVGTAEAKRAKPDGYTLLMGSTGALTARPIIADSGYQTDDFVPVAQLVTVPIALAVRAESPYHSLKDLVQAAEEKGVTYATPGPGSTQHISMAEFASEQHLKLTHVGGQGGKGAVTKALSGEVDFVFVGASNYTSLVPSGKLRVLAVASDERVPYLPDVPTFREAGYPLDAAVWFGLLVVKGTPPDRIDRLRDEVGKVAHEPKTLELYKRFNFTPSFLDAKAFGAEIARNVALHRKVLKSLGMAK